jgi:hypothetical protein
MLLNTQFKKIKQIKKIIKMNNQSDNELFLFHEFL